MDILMKSLKNYNGDVCSDALIRQIDKFIPKFKSLIMAIVLHHEKLWPLMTSMYTLAYYTASPPTHSALKNMDCLLLSMTLNPLYKDHITRTQFSSSLPTLSPDQFWTTSYSELRRRDLAGKSSLCGPKLKIYLSVNRTQFEWDKERAKQLDEEQANARAQAASKIKSKSTISNDAQKLIQTRIPFVDRHGRQNRAQVIRGKLKATYPYRQ